MTAFPQYRPSGRKAHEHFRNTAWSSLMPIGVILLFMLGLREPPGPGLWGMLGMCLGATLIYLGAWKLRQHSERLTAWGKKLHSSIDGWFPALTFLMQSLYLFIIAVAIWQSVISLGFDLPWWINLQVYLIVVLVVIKRYNFAAARETETPADIWWNHFWGYLLIIAAAGITGSSVTYAYWPATEASNREIPPLIVSVCVICVLVTLIVLMLMLERLVRRIKGDRADKPAPPEPESDSTTY